MRLQSPDYGAQVSIAPEAFGHGWVARVSYQEASTTHDGKRQVRRSETRVPIHAPMAILSVDGQRLFIVGIGTSVDEMREGDQTAVELAAR